MKTKTKTKKPTKTSTKKPATKVVPKSKEKSVPEQMAADITRVANKLNTTPDKVSKLEYFDNSKNFSEWDFRKVGGFASVKNLYFPIERDEIHVYDTANIRKEVRATNKQVGSIGSLLKGIETAVAEMPVLKYSPYKATKSKKADPRTLNLVLSDLHFGSDLTEEEHMYKFGVEEEARALAAIVKNVCSYKMEYRNETELVVNILGDVIENELHGQGSTDYLHQQTCRAMWLLSQAIQRFSENFPSVKVIFCVGNHGRDTAVHKQRATDLKWNALETTIYYGVRLSCQNLKNVTFIQPKTSWATYKAQGHSTYVTHGDTNLNPGNVGSTINLKGIENQINKINASLKDHEEYRVFAVGHVHSPTVAGLSNGVTFIANGALVPPNGFAQTLNIMESQLIQVMWESTEAHAVGDVRFINVTDQTKNKTLDSIIKPFVF
jgi:hypothetical protein